MMELYITTFLGYFKPFMLGLGMVIGAWKLFIFSLERGHIG